MPNRKGFYRIPHQIFLFGLTPIQFTVYSYLVSCASQQGICWPSYQTIARVCGVSRNTAIQAVEALVQQRIIDKTTTTGRDALGHTRTSNNEYRINDLSSLIPGQLRIPG